MPQNSKTVLRQTCGRCGQEFPGETLKHASVLVEAAVVAIGNSDPDESSPVEPAALVDRKVYCPSCVKQINLRRGAFIAVCVALVVAAFLIMQFVF